MNSAKIAIVSPHYDIGYGSPLPLDEGENHITADAPHLLRQVVDEIIEETKRPYPEVQKELVFLCSTYVTARETMAIYKELLLIGDEQIAYDDRLKPMQVGELTTSAFKQAIDHNSEEDEKVHGKRWKEFIFYRAHERHLADIGFKMPGGESQRDVFLRAKSFYDSLVEWDKSNMSYTLPVIMTHPVVASALYILLCKKDFSIYGGMPGLPPASMFVLDTEKGIVDGDINPFQ